MPDTAHSVDVLSDTGLAYASLAAAGICSEHAKVGMPLQVSSGMGTGPHDMSCSLLTSYGSGNGLSSMELAIMTRVGGVAGDGGWCMLAV